MMLAKQLKQTRRVLHASEQADHGDGTLPHVRPDHWWTEHLVNVENGGDMMRLGYIHVVTKHSALRVNPALPALSPVYCCNHAILSLKRLSGLYSVQPSQPSVL